MPNPLVGLMFGGAPKRWWSWWSWICLCIIYGYYKPTNTTGAPPWTVSRLRKKTTYRQSPWTYLFVSVVHCYLLFLLKFHQINCHLYPPLEFPLGNGGPGPHDYLVICILWVFHLWPLAFFRGILVAIWPHLVEAGGSIFLSSGLSTGITSVLVALLFVLYPIWFCKVKQKQKGVEVGPISSVPNSFLLSPKQIISRPMASSNTTIFVSSYG